MRSIKFRAWDEEAEYMYYSDDYENCTFCVDDKSGVLKCFVPETIDATREEPKHIVGREISPIMQYTGLKDKNNKEIYEGDICSILTCDSILVNVVCEWGIHRRIMDSGWEVDIPSFCFKRPDGLLSFPIVQNYIGKHDLEIMEVIGNIHENPDLLEKGQ